jgi:Starch-binding associating with outer membrane
MKKYIYLVMLFFTILMGCKKSYLDINTNPNSPTEGSITPDLILPRALHATASQVGAGYASVARWMGYWTRGGDYGPSTEEESYNITTNFGGGVWSGWYDNLNDYNVMEKKAAASGQKFYEGIAKTMKTIGFMNLVDVYNNVPYSKAFDLSNNITPAYDKGEDIYKDLFVQLDAALALIDAAVPGQDVKIESADVMFKGSAVMWKKLINTQRLKLVVRLSQTSLVTPATELAKVTADGFLGTGETAAVNPGYKKSFSGTNVSQQNPFWDTYEQDVAGVFNDKYNRANNYVLNIFKGTSDVRYTYYFDPAAAPLNGNTYFGYNYGFVDPDPNNPKSNNSSGVGGPGLARSFSQDQWLFTSVESKFLQAEAIQRGWLPGTAQTAYEAAVRESFVWLGVTNAVTTANTYLASGNAIVDWASNADKIKLIITQKYLGLVGINNFEAWAEYRRTGWPAVPKSLSPSVGANIPVRYRYPQSEYNYNPANVAAQNNPDPFTSGVFWDK